MSANMEENPMRGTLTDEEIAGSMAKILKAVETEYGAELR